VRGSGCWERGCTLPYERWIFFVWIKRDTHENFIDEIKVFLENYDKLGAKINKYIQYVEKEWK